MLEAVVIAVTGRPMRSVQEAFLVKGNAAAGAVKAQVNHAGGEDVVEVRLSREQRVIRVNGQEKSRADLPGPGALTVFTPADLALTQGSPQERRRFIDYEVAAGFSSYAGLYQRYQRVLWQKNRALATASDTGVWDEQLVFYGARIMALRNRWLHLFARSARELYREIGDAVLDVGLTRSFPAAAAEDEAEAAKGLAAVLAGPAARRMEFVAVGPHRDDLTLAVAGQNARHSSSQGEQRTVALCLRLAGHRLRRRELGENPLIVLDDAFYELDAKRREKLLAVLADGSQVLATAHAPPGGGRIFKVAGGSITG